MKVQYQLEKAYLKGRLTKTYFCDDAILNIMQYTVFY